MKLAQTEYLFEGFFNKLFGRKKEKKKARKQAKGKNGTEAANKTIAVPEVIPTQIGEKLAEL